MFGRLIATIIGLLVVVLSGTFVTIMNPIVGIPFILCGIFLLLFPNFLSNKLFDRAKGSDSGTTANDAEAPAIPRIETYKLIVPDGYTEALQSLGVPNPDYDLDRAEIIQKQIGGENLYPYLFEPQQAVMKIKGEDVTVAVHDLDIGTIGRNNRERVRRLITDDGVASAVVKIDGGPRRILSAQDGELHDYHDDYSVRLEITVRTNDHTDGEKNESET